MNRLGNVPEYAEKIFDMAAVSVLWIIFSLPIITVGASTAALYHTVHKVWKQRRGYAAEVFVKAFWLNLKDSVKLWLAVTVAMVVLQLNIGIIQKHSGSNLGIFVMLFYRICLGLIWGVQMYLFPALSRFDMPAGWVLKLSVYLCFRHLVRTVLLLMITAMVVFLCDRYFPLLLILPFITQYLNHNLLEPVFMQHMPLSVTKCN